MYLAKPYDRNMIASKQFNTMQECKKYLDEFTSEKNKTEELYMKKMPLDEWLILGKILEVMPDGNTRKIDVDMDSFL